MQADRILFLTLDLINDLVHPEGKFALSAPQVAARNVLAHANAGLAWARRRGIQVAHAKVGFPAGYPNAPTRSPMLGAVPASGGLLLGTWGTNFHADLEVDPAEPVFVKPRISGFYGTGLESLLRIRNVEQIILCGVSTPMAVELTAREAHDRDYRVAVLEPACAAATPELHQGALAGPLGRLAQVLDLAGLDELIR